MTATAVAEQTTPTTIPIDKDFIVTRRNFESSYRPHAVGGTFVLAGVNADVHSDVLAGMPWAQRSVMPSCGFTNRQLEKNPTHPGEARAQT